MCPVTAKPGRRRNKDRDKQRVRPTEKDYIKDRKVRKSYTHN